MKEDKMEHYLIVRFKKGVNVRELYEPIRELFSQADQIEGIKKAEVFLSSARLRSNYDMMIKITMKKGSLESFENSELCHRWNEEYSEYISRISEFDS